MKCAVRRAVHLSPTDVTSMEDHEDIITKIVKLKHDLM